MKKIFLINILCLLIIPFMVNAKDYCKIVNSSGKSIGSEMKCGTESFYVIENKNNTIKMLAKYSLNVGDRIDYFDIDGTKPTYTKADFLNLASVYCLSAATSKGYNPYYVYPMSDDPNAATVELKGCRVYEVLNEEYTRQDERASGTKLVNGKSVLPLYGITYMNPEWGYEAIHDYIYRTNEYDSNGDLIISGSSFEKYLNDYKAELIRQEINVSNVSFITLNRTISFLEAISGKDINVKLEYPDADPDPDVNNPENYIGKMNIKDYTGSIKWFYDRTYWLGSGFRSTIEQTPSSAYNDYYVSNEGFLCALGRGECGYLAYPIGNGLRPLVTISNKDVKFKIKTLTDGHGTIEVVDTALGGDSIKFRVNAARGYELQSLIVKSDDGKSIEFRRGQMIKNNDGTISIDKNNFTMPYENVTIQARWATVINNNPKTGTTMLAVIVLIIAASAALFLKQQAKDIKNI
ncbi:MAG: hypothetical protein IJL76_03120 [Bacilli bacterium]|nr:hypothetical protein [Bacilli bacterium]